MIFVRHSQFLSTVDNADCNFYTELRLKSGKKNMHVLPLKRTARTCSCFLLLLKESFSTATCALSEISLRSLASCKAVPLARQWYGAVLVSAMGQCVLIRSPWNRVEPCLSVHCVQTLRSSSALPLAVIISSIIHSSSLMQVICKGH